jgi:hypothetical protein
VGGWAGAFSASLSNRKDKIHSNLELDEKAVTIAIPPHKICFFVFANTRAIFFLSLSCVYERLDLIYLLYNNSFRNV